jgi:threonine dehydratase
MAARPYRAGQARQWSFASAVPGAHNRGMSDPSIVDLDAIRAAAWRIAPHAHRTPVLRSRALDAATGTLLYCKCENFQRSGSFKFRGAANTVFSLPEAAAARGVLTHSSGNHGAALALAAQIRGIPATVVVPAGAAAPKVEAIRRYGARIVECAPTLADREATAAQVQAETGAELVHPYNDWRVIAGQGTAALELLEEWAQLDALVVPLGGGGLLSGTALAAAGWAERIQVHGVEPVGADEARRSLAAGRLLPLEQPATIADGLRAAIGPITFEVIRQRATSVVAVDDAAIVRAMRLVWETMKIVIEPSCAVTIAALREGALDLRSRRVGVIFTGGNVDLDRLPWSMPGGSS